MPSTLLSIEKPNPNGDVPAGISLLEADDFQTWLLSIEVLGESVYKVRPICSPTGAYFLITSQGEVFALQFIFENTYPISPPSVTFVVNDKFQSPEHPVGFTALFS